MVKFLHLYKKSRENMNVDIMAYQVNMGDQ